MDSKATFLTLSEYLGHTSDAIKNAMGDYKWVVFDIIDIKSSRGHYYLEIGELDDNKTLLSKSSLNIWASKANGIMSKFKKEAGFELSKNTKVMALCNISLNPKFGISMNMIDINPTYTLGVDKSSIKSILGELDKLGITNNNKRFPEPTDFNRILVLSPNNAAGLGDFKSDADKLSDAGVCKFDYYYATFQGDNASESIRDELVKIFKLVRDSGVEYDALVIIRGGGATTDLSHLNSITIARAICQFNIPVYVGVGHERDETVLDYVANIKFDTPSKVILFIKNKIISNYNEINSSLNRIKNGSVSYIDRYINTIDMLKKDNQRKAINIIYNLEKVIASCDNSIKSGSNIIINNLNNYLSNYNSNLNFKIINIINKDITHIENINKQNFMSLIYLTTKEIDLMSNTTSIIKRNSMDMINKELNEIEMLYMKIDKHNPDHIKKLGYGIIKTNKGSLKRVSDIGRNKKIIIEMMDGLIYTNIEKIEINED